MDITLAQRAHIPALLKLLHQVGQVHHEIRPDIFASGALKYDTPALEALLTDPDAPIYVALMEGEVAGYCFCRVKRFAPPLHTPRGEFYIDDLCVDEAHRRMGVAQALYDHVLAQAKDMGCHSVTLNVWCGNDGAMAFYEKQGMTPRNIVMEKVL